MTTSPIGEQAAPSEVRPKFSSRSVSARLRQPTVEPERVETEIASTLSRSSSQEYLVGRESEIEQLDWLIGRVRAGSGTLMINGEAGIGKSALLERARDRATELGARALVAVGVESEAELAFAGMHQLLQPIIGTVELLPSPQRLAIEAAFGIASDAAPDPFLVALAAHHLSATRLKCVRWR